MSGTKESSISQTSKIIDHLAQYGATPAFDEVDTRHLPHDAEIDMAMTCLFEATATLFASTQIEGDLEQVLWGITNVFQQRVTSTQKRKSHIDDELKQLIAIQDGSEINSVELEKQQIKSEKLNDHALIYEGMRDIAAEHFEAQTGTAWLPRTGNKVSNRTLTASVIDSKSYLMAERRKETEILCPEGTRIAFAGGEFQDYEEIWSALDAALAKYPDMILLHGGGTKGAELIASKWASNRNVTQVAFKPDWKSHGKAAPFKRNDELLKLVPQGLIAAPGSGIVENLVDKAKKMGIGIKRIGA